MKFGLFYLFSDFGQIAQDRLFHELHSPDGNEPPRP
jgi:hypothetical protein